MCTLACHSYQHKHFGMVSEIGKKYTYKCVDRLRHNKIVIALATTVSSLVCVYVYGWVDGWEYDGGGGGTSNKGHT